MVRPVVAVRLTAIGVGLAYTVFMLVAGVRLDDPLRQLVATLPVAAIGLLILWDTQLWRRTPFKHLHHRPHLRGLWSVTLRPTAESHIPEEGSRGPIAAYMVVQQSFWSVQVRQYTQESTSDSRASFWQKLPGADTEGLAFLYANSPRQVHQHRSMPHLGSCTLDSARREPKNLTGVYFTDRYTKGDMELALIDRTKGYANFAEADAQAERVRGTS